MAKKKYDDDDGRTIVNMNVDGMPWYLNETQQKNREGLRKIKLTRKERRAITLASYRALLPMFICIGISFTIVALLLWLWLK